MKWDDARIVAFDVETSGELPEYALQPWRMARGQMWVTSASAIRHDGAELSVHLSQLFPTCEQLRKFLEDALANDWIVLGWNIAFDISVLIAMGLTDLVMKVRWLDGMLLWRHLEIEPEYEFQSARHKKKSYALKPGAVQQWIPSFAGLDEDVQFHSTDPAELAKLQRYNDRDNVRAWTIAKLVWVRLAPEQRRAALIEAECLPLVAQANVNGLVVDRLTVRHLGAKLDADAAARLAELAPHGMTETIVRSPKQLSELMFDQWKLPVLKVNKSKVEGKEDSRSTDKEVLHELAFLDPRVRLVKQYREALNARGKFCDSVLKSLDYNGDGRVHPITHVFSTYTGRCTVSSKQGRGKDERQIGYALHQMKREKEFREFNTAPEGYSIIEVDAAGQEFRWMAVASGDPTMLQLCMPGEDAHSYMGARIVHCDYRELIRLHAEGDKVAGQNRYLGKFANLCIAEGSTILTDRGPCSIEHVRDDDLVWDGEEFVAHAGVRFSGVLPVMSHQGVTGTPDHKVLCHGEWVRLDEAAQMGWEIEPALGTGRSSRGRSAVRIVDGLIRRALREVRGALRSGALRLWARARCELAISGGRPVHAMQGLRDPGEARKSGTLGGCCRRGPEAAKAGQRLVSAVQELEVPILPQLWGAWDRVSVLLRPRWRRVYQASAATPHLSRARHRSKEQQRSLRAWKLALGYSQAEPREPIPTRCYDIVSCGPRTRFAADGRVVHNSLQYRTSAVKLRSKARVDYDIPLELPEARRIHKTYQDTYPNVPRYWDRQIAMVRRLGYVETFAGRRVQVVGDWDGKWGWSMGSTAINTRIQGTGADQKYLALAVLKPYLAEIGASFAFELHDGLYFYVPDCRVESAVDRMKKMLDSLPYRQAWGFTPPIPMPWDCKVGKAWGRLKERKFGP